MLDSCPNRMFLKALHAFLIVTILLITAAVHAEPAKSDNEDYINPDRPGIADGSNVVGEGRLQIESGFQREYRHDVTSRSNTTFIPNLIRFGLSENLEARLESNTYTWMRSRDAAEGLTRDEGFSAASLGFKYHFVDSLGSDRPSVGVIVRVSPPSGAGEFRSIHTTGDFRLAADWDFAPQWSLNPNLGIAFYEDDTRRSYTTGLFAATLNYNPNKQLNLFVDVGAQSREARFGGASAVVDFGFAYIVGRDVQIDFSIGFGIAGKTSPRRFLSAGLSKRF